MLDYQRIVDDLRSFVQASGRAVGDELRRAAADYVQACREVNDRLRRCEDFLQRGLRSEAIHFAEAEPVLLDAVAILDFPERGVWEQSAAVHGLPAPPRLQLETAAALNRAYADEQPLEALLKQHRRLALARAPLAGRMALLRQIWALDANNSVWGEDLAVLEAGRFRQMQAEAEAAAARTDAAALVALVQELNQTAWSVPPPESLVKTIEKSAQGSFQQNARNQLERLEGELQAAFTLCDADRARPLREQWNGLVQQAALPPGDPLCRRAEPVFAWLEQAERHAAAERTYQDAVAGLERALDADRPAEELGRLYHALRATKRRPTPELEKRYHDRLDELQAAASRREKIILAGTFAAGVMGLVGFLVFLLVRSH